MSIYDTTTGVPWPYVRQEFVPWSIPEWIDQSPMEGDDVLLAAAEIIRNRPFNRRSEASLRLAHEEAEKLREQLAYVAQMRQQEAT